MSNNANSGSQPRYGYDDDKFYDAIYTLALQGATNEEIGPELLNVTGDSLSASTFTSMVSGHYSAWTEEENERRSKKLQQTLESARYGLNRIVRGRFLKCALGGIKVKSKTTVKRKLRIDGVYTDDIEIQTTETESESPPNVGALQTWLRHYDSNWRAVERGEEIDDIGKVKKGIDVGKWIEKETSGV